MSKKVTIAEEPKQKVQVGKYVDLLTDYGFKKIFGEENKELLIYFLNSVLPLTNPIVDLQYTNVEQKGRIKSSRNAFFDLQCITSKDEYIIIEVQYLPQPYFEDRVLYYSTFPIQRQAKKGKWDFNLNPVYSVNILNFSLNKTNKRYFHHIQLMDTKSKTVFYDKLTYVFIELSDFTKTESNVRTIKDWWFYLLKNLPKLESIPVKLKKNKIFNHLFGEAETANLPSHEYDLYVESLKVKYMYTPQDIINSYQRELGTSRKTISTLSNLNSTLSNKVSTLSDKNSTLSSQNSTLSNKVSTLSSQNSTLSNDNATLIAKIAELERKLNQTGID
jgi:predicted transposase/invertase (TIGR01784 family)